MRGYSCGHRGHGCGRRHGHGSMRSRWRGDGGWGRASNSCTDCGSLWCRGWWKRRLGRGGRRCLRGRPGRGGDRRVCPSCGREGRCRLLHWGARFHGWRRNRLFYWRCNLAGWRDRLRGGRRRGVLDDGRSTLGARLHRLCCCWRLGGPRELGSMRLRFHLGHGGLGARARGWGIDAHVGKGGSLFEPGNGPRGRGWMESRLLGHIAVARPRPLTLPHRRRRGRGWGRRSESRGRAGRCQRYHDGLGDHDGPAFGAQLVEIPLQNGLCANLCKRSEAGRVNGTSIGLFSGCLISPIRSRRRQVPS